MKKISMIFILFLLLFPIFPKAKENLITVKFSKCVDGDTANVVLNNKKVKIRFLAVDTPETKHPTKGEEFYGKEASNYTCNKLRNASKLQIEYDENSDKLDKYDRHLVWLWADNNLLQMDLVKNGYAKVAYLYGNYKYTSILQEEEKIAKKNKLGMWQNNNNEINYWLLMAVIIIIIILCFISTKFRKETTKKIKREAKKSIKKMFR